MNRLTVYHTRISAIKAWLSSAYVSFKDTNRLVFLKADTLTIRALLACSSLISALSLVFDPDKFDRPSYELVGKFGPEWLWIVYFMAHCIGVTWRIYERSVSRPKVAVVINAWGFSIWFVSTTSIAISGSVGFPLSVSITMCAASAWALYRTGLSKDVVSL